MWTLCINLKFFLVVICVSLIMMNNISSFFFYNTVWFFFNFIYLFIYLWLCWVFVSVRGLSLVTASGGHSSSRCAGLSLSWPLLLRSTGSKCAGSVVVAHGPSCSAACGIFPDQGSNPCPLHWQADSQPLRHQGSPIYLLDTQLDTLKNLHTLMLCFVNYEVWYYNIVMEKKTISRILNGLLSKLLIRWSNLLCSAV